MDELTPDEKAVIKAVLLSDVIACAMGADEWDLNLAEEMLLWDIIGKLKA